MATYLELRNLYNDSELRNRVAVAIAIAADTVMRGTDNVAPFSQTAGDHDLRVIWAKGALGNTEGFTPPFWQSALAANSTLTVAQITGATDAALQSKINEAVDLFSGVTV